MSLIEIHDDAPSDVQPSEGDEKDTKRVVVYQGNPRLLISNMQDRLRKTD